MIIRACFIRLSSRRTLLLGAALVAWLLSLGSIAPAATVYWDNTSPISNAGFGAAGGTWGTDAKWNDNSTGGAPGGGFPITNTGTGDAVNFGSGTNGLTAGTGVSVSGSAQGFNTLTFASTAGAIVVSGGTSITMSPASTITVANASDTISTPLVGAATSFTKAGTGILILNGNNSYTGATIINASGGTLRLGNANALGTTAAGTTVGSGGALDLNNQTIGAEDVALSGTGISSAGALINSGNSAASLSGAITLNAASTISQTNAAGSLTLSGNITNGANLLTIGNGAAGTVTLDGVLGNGAGGLTMTSNSGTLNLNGNNTYTGLTTINTGNTVRIGHASALGTTANGVTVNSGGTLDLNNQAVGAEAMNLSGAGAGGALQNSGNSAASLTGAITLGAATTISQTNASGSLTLGGNITNGTNLLTIGNGVAGTVTLNGVLGSGSGGLALAANSGTLNLNGNNSYTGQTTIGSTSTLKLGHASALGGTGTGTPSTVVSSGGVLDLNGFSTGESITLAGTGISSNGALVNGGGTATLTARIDVTTASTIGGSGDILLNGGISGGGSAFTKTGSNKITLPIAATGRGNGSATTIINGGTVRVGDASALATVNAPSTTVNNTAALELSNSISFFQPIVLNDGSTLRSDGSNTVFYGSGSAVNVSTAVSAVSVTIATVSSADLFTVGLDANDVTGGNGTDDTIHIAGPGTVRLGQSSNYIGNWSLDAGTTQLGNAAALGATAARTVDLSAGATLAGRLAANTTFTANPITVSGSGTATIQHDRSSAGAGVVYTFGTLGIGSQTLAINSVSGGNVTNNTTYGITLGATTLSGNSIFDVANNGSSTGTLTLASINSPAGTSLTKNGAGALTITASGPSIASLIYNAGALNLSGTLTVGSNTQTALTMRDTTINNNITLAGAFGGDDFVFDATNNGTATLGGTIDIGNRTTVWNIGNGSAATDMQINGGITGTSGTVTKSGAGLLLFAGANSYTGLTEVLSGTLAESSTGSIANTSALTVNGATAVFDLGSNHSDTVATVTLDGGGLISGTGTSALTVNSTDTFEMKSGTASAILAGTAPLNKTTAGTVTLSGNNAYTGLTTISGGTLKLGAAGNATNAPLGTTAAGTIVNSNGALDLSGFSLGTAEALTLNGTGVSSGGALTNSSATAATYSGLIALGSASSIVTSNGNIVISNAGTIIGSGFGLTLDGTASGSSIASIIGTGSGTLTKNGAGTWTLSGANTYTGATLVTAGTLAEASTGSIADTSALTVNGATAVFNLGSNHSDTVATVTLDGGGLISGSGTSALTVNSPDTYEMKFGTAGAILAGSAALNKSTSSMVTLSGDNTYSGLTNVNAGKLVVNGNQSAATGNVTVAAGATLAGLGTIGGNTNILGTHSPGNSPGIQSFVGNLSYSGGASIVQWELKNDTVINAANPNAIFDTIVVGGNLNFSGLTALQLAFNSPGSLVDWNDSFWTTQHVGTGGWLLYDVAGVTSNPGNLTITVSNWADGNGLLFNTAHPAWFFALSQQGQDIYLEFLTVPEPSTAVLLGVGMMGMALLIRNRKRAAGQRRA